jgi:hypothetical protein
MIDRATPSDLRLAELRLVEWELVADTPSGPSPSTSREVVPASESRLLVDALLKLHHDPGVNPHSGRKTARLSRLRVGTPELLDGYWWTGPTLQDEGPKARLVGWRFETVWDRSAIDEPPDPV